MFVARERLTVAATVKTLTGSVYAPASGPCTVALITVETAAIRVTLDGTDPVAGTTGHLVQAGQVIELNGHDEIRCFKAIREASTSAAIECTYKRG